MGWAGQASECWYWWGRPQPSAPVGLHQAPHTPTFDHLAAVCGGTTHGSPIHVGGLGVGAALVHLRPSHWHCRLCDLLDLLLTQLRTSARPGRQLHVCAHHNLPQRQCGLPGGRHAPNAQRGRGRPLRDSQQQLRRVCERGRPALPPRWQPIRRPGGVCSPGVSRGHGSGRVLGRADG